MQALQGQSKGEEVTENTIQTLIIVAGALIAIAMIGGMIVWSIWRKQTGRNALEADRRAIESKKAWAAANEQLTGKK